MEPTQGTKGKRFLNPALLSVLGFVLVLALTVGRDMVSVPQSAPALDNAMVDSAETDASDAYAALIADDGASEDRTAVERVGGQSDAPRADSDANPTLWLLGVMLLALAVAAGAIAWRWSRWRRGR